MSWLIEAYLDEGKHGPDHPESLGMKNKDDYMKKMEKEEEKEDEESDRVGDREMNKLAHNHKILKSDYEKAKNGEAGYGTDEYKRINHAMKKDFEKHKKFGKKYGLQTDLYPRETTYAKDAAERHNRRHPESKVATESHWLVEALLDEEMRNASDFHQKKRDEQFDRMDSSQKALDRGNRLIKADNSTISKDDQIAAYKHTLDAGIHGQRAGQHMALGNDKGIEKEMKAAADSGEKAASYYRKDDAKNRHERKQSSK